MNNIKCGEICLFPYKWFEVNDIRINFNSTYEEVHKLLLFSKTGQPSCFSKSETDEQSDFSEYAGSIKFIYNEDKLKSVEVYGNGAVVLSSEYCCLDSKWKHKKKAIEKIYDEICETAGICILDKFGMIIMFGDPSEYIISRETDFKNRTEKYCKNYLPS